MRRAGLLALAAWLGCACGASAPSSDGGTDGGGGGAGTDPLADAWLAAHNTERSGAQPTPVPALAPLTWNTSAAATAAAWVAQCRFQHNPGRGSLGENIFAGSGAAGVTTSSVVRDWASEKANYTWATNTCASGKACGHYTQIVWRDTASVGCARAVCTANSPFGGGTWQFWVCDYAPPGNFVGERPY